MELSPKGIEFIEQQESLRLMPYQDVGGRWTVGFGHLMTSEESTTEGITPEEAAQILTQDLQTSVDAVNRLVAVSLEQYQFDPLVSFVFNVGVEDFETSTMLRYLNAGEFNKAATQFPLWDHIHGVVCDGLLARRNREMHIFTGETQGD